MKKLFKLPVKATRILWQRLQTQGWRITLIWVYARGLPMVTGIPTKNYSRITPEIYVGPQYRQSGKHKLQQWGIDGDVNMRIEFDDAAHNLALPHYCHLPTVDDTAPTIDHLQQGVEFIDRVVAGGGKVYIHCAGGIGRAPTMAAAYFMSQGHTLAEAIALIKKSRPFINITPPQLAQLKRFETMQLEYARKERRHDD